MNFGMRVTITHRLRSGHDYPEVLRNVGEIHYRFAQGRRGPRVDKIAFESDVHRAGVTYQLKDIAEFVAVPETAMAEEF